MAISEIKPLDVERKINDFPVSKKTKSHIKMQMHRVFEFAMKCELIEFQRNLSVEIRGARGRVRRKQVLTPEQFQTLLCNADLRLQTMMTLACCLGLRPSEFLGLQWPDLDVSRGVLMVSRSITGLHIEGTKTPDSEDEIVLDPRSDSLAALATRMSQLYEAMAFSKSRHRKALSCRFSERRSSASCRAGDWYPKPRMVRLPSHLSDTAR